MAHQFRCGQLVRYCCSIRYGAADGDYEIVRQLPDEEGELQYRIKSVREPHERVVKESDLVPAPVTERPIALPPVTGRSDEWPRRIMSAVGLNSARTRGI
jgi:hypothetical protein